MTNKKGKKATRRAPYKRLTEEFVVQQLMDWYDSPKESITKFFMARALNSKRRSLDRIAREVNMFAHKKDGTPYKFMHTTLQVHLRRKKLIGTKNLNKVHESNRVLTSDEVRLLVDTCTLMANMGLGVEPETCLDQVNAILAKQIEQADFVPVTIAVVKRIIANNSNLLRLVRGNSIDTKRVRQADKDVRNAMFVKLDNYIKILHMQGKVPWKSWSKVPPECMSNMDELAMNTHGHCKKDHRTGVLLQQQTNLPRNKLWRQ